MSFFFSFSDLIQFYYKLLPLPFHMKKSTSTYTSKRARFNKYQPNELGNFICVDCGLTTRDARKFFKHNRMGCEAHNDELVRSRPDSKLDN